MKKTIFTAIIGRANTRYDQDKSAEQTVQATQKSFDLHRESGKGLRDYQKLYARRRDRIGVKFICIGRRNYFTKKT